MEDDIVLALKIKLLPTKDQVLTLDELFGKWASICTRLGSRGLEQDDLSPPSEFNGKLHFSKTQLNSATGDIKTAREALDARCQKLNSQVVRLDRDVTALKEAIVDSNKREIDKTKETRFYPKAWVRTGQLIRKYYPLGYFKRRLEHDERKLKRMKETVEKLKHGKVHFSPRRITIWASSLRFRFGNDPQAVISLTDVGEPLSIKLQLKPDQELVGSSKKSADFYENAILNFLAYSIKARLFGFSNSERFLLKARKPEKVQKKEAMLRKKTENLPSKIIIVEKWIGRQLSIEEKSVIEEEFTSVLKGGTIENKKFVCLLSNLATSILIRSEPILLNKYGIIIRKPIGKAKTKNVYNIKSDEWEYYLQLGYSPVLSPKLQYEPKSFIGIDRGVTHSVALTLFDPVSKKFVVNLLYPNPVAKWKRRNKCLVRALQKLKRRIKSQNGETLHFNQMRKRLHSVENRAENYWHNLASQIIKLAYEHKAAIVLERLENLRQSGRKKTKYGQGLRYALSLFDYKKIASLISYKASRDGVPVYDVDPKYTSKTCSACLLHDRVGSEFPGDKYVRGIDGNFKRGYCPVCREINNNSKSEIDADLNAARVIALCVQKKRGMPRKVN
ncbi:MAG: transposase [Candidatus Micrarchaeia archaeon]